MSDLKKYEYATITIHLTNVVDDAHKVYEQTFPLFAVSQYEAHWLKKVIAIINGLEVKNV